MVMEKVNAALLNWTLQKLKKT